MFSLSYLQQQAIDASKNKKWESAKHYNQEILSQYPNNISALNRIGFCYLQLGKCTEAQKTYQKVLKLDKHNPVAKKYLEILKKRSITPSGFKCSQQYIQEPGKTTIVTLKRLAGNDIVSELSNGTECTLKPKSRYVSVESTQGTYIGSIQEDVSYRLSKLLKTGNMYDCTVYNTEKQTCKIFIKEVYRSEKNKHICSFPVDE